MTRAKKEHDPSIEHEEDAVNSERENLFGSAPLLIAENLTGDDSSPLYFKWKPPTCFSSRTLITKQHLNFFFKGLNTQEKGFSKYYIRDAQAHSFDSNNKDLEKDMIGYVNKISSNYEGKRIHTVLEDLFIETMKGDNIYSNFAAGCIVSRVLTQENLYLLLRSFHEKPLLYISELMNDTTQEKFLKKMYKHTLPQEEFPFLFYELKRLFALHEFNFSNLFLRHKYSEIENNSIQSYDELSNIMEKSWNIFSLFFNSFSSFYGIRGQERTHYFKNYLGISSAYRCLSINQMKYFNSNYCYDVFENIIDLLKKQKVGCTFDSYLDSFGNNSN